MIYNKITAPLRGFIELPELKLEKYKYRVSLEFFEPQVFITEDLYNTLVPQDIIAGECELELTALSNTGFMYEATAITLVYREGGGGGGSSTSIQNLQWNNAAQTLQLVTDSTTFTANLSSSFETTKDKAIQETIDYTKINAYVRNPVAGDDLKQNDVITYQGNLYSLVTNFTWTDGADPSTDTTHFLSLKAEGSTYKGFFADDNSVVAALTEGTLKLGDIYQAPSVIFGSTEPLVFIVFNPEGPALQNQVLPLANNYASYINGDNSPPSRDKYLSSQKTYEELLKKQDKLLHTFFFASFEPITETGVSSDTYTLKQDITLIKGIFSKNLTTTDNNFTINFRSNPSNLTDTIPSGQIIRLLIPANLTNTTSSINFNIESTFKLISNNTSKNVAMNVTNITLNTTTQQKLIDLVVMTDVPIIASDMLELSLKFILEGTESCTVNLEIGEISNPMYVDFVTTASKLDPSIIIEDTNIGEIRAMHRATPPNETWLLCDGQTYKEVDYPDLYQILKANTPSLIIDDSTFKTPDLRDGYLRSANNNSNLGENLTPALPNIKGTFRISDTKNLLGSASGALMSVTGYGGYDVSTRSSFGKYCGVDLNARAYNSIYQDDINEVRPQSTITNYFIKAKANIQNFSSVIAKPIVGQVYPKNSLIIWDGVIYKTTTDTTYSSLTPNWVPYGNQTSTLEASSAPLKGALLDMISYPIKGQEYLQGSAIWFEGQIYQALNTNTWNDALTADWGIYTPSNIVPINNLLGKGSFPTAGDAAVTIPISQRASTDVITVEGSFSGSVSIVNGFKLRVIMNLSNGAIITPTIISRSESNLTQQRYNTTGPWFNFCQEPNNIDYSGELVTFSMTFENMTPGMNARVFGKCSFVKGDELYEYSLVLGTDTSKQLDATKIESITVALHGANDLPVSSNIFVYLDNRNIIQTTRSGGDLAANLNNALDTNQLTAVSEAIAFTKDNLYVRQPNANDQLIAKEIILYDGILYRTKNPITWTPTTNPSTDSVNFELVVPPDTGSVTDLRVVEALGGSKELVLVTTGKTFSTTLPSGGIDSAAILYLLQMFYQQGQLIGELLSILSVFNLPSLTLPENFFLTYKGNIYKTKQEVIFTSSSTPDSDITNYEPINKNIYNWIDDDNPSVSVARVVTTVVTKTTNNFSMPKDPFCATWIATIQDENGVIISYTDTSTATQINLEFAVTKAKVKIKIEQYCTR